MSETLRITGQIVDIAGRRTWPGAVVVVDGRVAALEPSADPDPGYLMPGFVDAHIHVESSLLAPSAFARLAVRHGTVAAVCDPHEIANVLGVDGVGLMLDAGAQTPFHFGWGAPPCVPATAFETSGATLGPAEVARLLADPRVTHLSEVMNVPGVLAGDPELGAKLAAARAAGRPIDGHAPGLGGAALAAYAAAGPSTDHESTTLDEAREKLALGIRAQIREGSAARNLDALLPLLDEAPGAVMLCSDDLHPDELQRGHIDRLVRRAVAAGIDVYRALQAACVTPVEHYRLPVGLLRPGDPADLIRVDDLARLEVVEVWLRGAPAWREDRCLLRPAGAPRRNRFEARPLAPEELRVPAGAGRLRALGVADRSLLTEALALPPRIEGGLAVADPGRDLLKIAVKSRYDDRPPAVAFVRGFGLRRGALAGSVAHDSHNVIGVGADDASLLQAMNLVIQARGGLAVVGPHGHRLLPLPLAGLMSDQEGPEVAAAYAALQHDARALGGHLDAPLMTLSFLALLVIPHLKLSDRGLFDGDRFGFVGPFDG